MKMKNWKKETILNPISTYQVKAKKKETSENFEHVKHESQNEQLDTLEIEKSENSEEDDFTEKSLPPVYVPSKKRG